MQPLDRLTAYIEEYRHLVYDYYNNTIPIVPVTYYWLDDKATKYDENYISTYRNSGPLSGKRWRKIYFYPVSFAQAVQPSMNSSEKGITTWMGTESSVVVDAMQGVMPRIGDIIKFDITGSYGWWVVSNIDYSAPLIAPLYKCTISQYRLRDNIDKYLTDELVYVELAKKIYPKDVAKRILSIFVKIEDIIEFLNDLYDYRLGLHYFSNEHKDVFFPEIDNILHNNYTLATELFKDNVYLHVAPNEFTPIDNSYLVWYCQPDMFKHDSVVFGCKHSGRFTERVYGISEYITSTNGNNICTVFDYSFIPEDGKLYYTDNPSTNNLRILNLWYELVVNKTIGAFESIIPTNFIEAVSIYGLLIRYAMILYNKNKELR